VRSLHARHRTNGFDTNEPLLTADAQRGGFFDGDTPTRPAVYRVPQVAARVVPGPTSSLGADQRRRLILRPPG
jgi:hypothetical protein